jgi:hypothetical protein
MGFSGMARIAEIIARMRWSGRKEGNQVNRRRGDQVIWQQGEANDLLDGELKTPPDNDQNIRITAGRNEYIIQDNMSWTKNCAIIHLCTVGWEEALTSPSR